MAKQKRIKPFQSTQQNLPVKAFYNGIIIDKNDDISKIIEVIPSPFYMVTQSQRNAIGESFEKFLKNAPRTLHIKCVSMAADLSNQINKAQHDVATEKDAQCKKMGEEYIQTLENAQSYGISRKFYISFPYEGRIKKNDPNYLQRVSAEMANAANRMAESLKDCNNGSILSAGINDPNYMNGQIFYNLLNRGSYAAIPYDKRVEEVNQRYLAQYIDKGITNNIYVPATDYIAPLSIDFSDAEYVRCDGMYYTFLYIPSNGYRSPVTYGWLNGFINSGIGIDVDIFLEQQDSESLGFSLRRTIGQQQVEASENSNPATDAFSQVRQTLDSAYYLKNGLGNGQDMYQMSVIITICSNNLATLKDNEAELISRARANDMSLKRLRFQEEDAFKTVLPLPKLDKNLYGKMHRNVLTEGAASTYPFTTFELMDKDGIYIADDLSTGSPVIPDFFDRNAGWANPNIFVCGKTGAGKSVTIQLLGLRARVDHIPVYILAPEKENEFKRVCKHIGGQFVSFGSGSDARINIFDINMPDRDALRKQRLIDGEDVAEQKLLPQKISQLLTFFGLFIPNLSISNKQVLNDAINQTYYRVSGITDDNESLWADSSKTRMKKMPIMQDLVDTLMDSDDSQSNQLGKIISLLTTGSGAHFNGQTNIDLNNEFFVIGLEHNENEMLGLSIYAALEYIWSKATADRTRKKMLIIDEFWRLCFDPTSCQRVMAIARLCRAYSCSMVLATQQMDDILGSGNSAYGQSILNACVTKIILGLEDKAVQTLQTMINLTPSECTAITRFKPGQGLLIAGEKRMKVQFNPSYTERMLTFTDAESIKYFAEIEKKRKEKAKEKYEIEHAKNASDVLKGTLDIKTDKVADDDYYALLMRRAEARKNSVSSKKTDDSSSSATVIYNKSDNSIKKQNSINETGKKPAEKLIDSEDYGEILKQQLLLRRQKK